MHTCTPAAAGELAEQRSNDPRVVVADHRPHRVTICAIKTRVSQGKGCEGGAACLRRHSEVGKPVPEVSRAGARPDGGTDRILSMGRNGDPTTCGLPS